MYGVCFPCWEEDHCVCVCVCVYILLLLLLLQNVVVTYGGMVFYKDYVYDPYNSAGINIRLSIVCVCVQQCVRLVYTTVHCAVCVCSVFSAVCCVCVQCGRQPALLLSQIQRGQRTKIKSTNQEHTNCIDHFIIVSIFGNIFPLIK